MLRAFSESERVIVGSGPEAFTGRTAADLDRLDGGPRSRSVRFLSGRLAGRLGDWGVDGKTGLDHPSKSRS